MSNSASAFKALSLAIVKGFVRDKTSVFFAVVFPLMFLVLFGGLFADQTQSKVDLIQVGDVALVDDLPKGADEAFEETFEVEHFDDLDSALKKVRKGDADVAIEMKGDTLVAHYTQTDQVKAAITQGALQAFVDGTNVALSGAAPEVRPRGRAGRGRLPQDHPVLHARAARLGGGDERRLRRRGDDPGLAAVQADPAAPARAGLDRDRGRRPRLGDGRHRPGAAGDLRRPGAQLRSGSP